MGCCKLLRREVRWLQMLTDKQKEEANSRGDLSSSNESKNEADKIKDEEGR